MSDPRPLTRDELSRFLPTQRAIRAFEKLFEQIPSETESLLTLVYEVATVAESAASLSQEGLAGINRLSEAIELLAQAPAKEFSIADDLNPILSFDQQGSDILPPAICCYLGNLVDVEAAAPSDTFVLTFDAASNKWKPAAGGGGGGGGGLTQSQVEGLI
jgi:hypothetical protein